MGIKLTNVPAWKLNIWGAECDHCKAELKKLGVDPGEASELARKEGWTTKSVRVDLPMTWLCYACSKKGSSNAR